MVTLIIEFIIEWLTIWACFAALCTVCGCVYALFATREVLTIVGLALAVGGLGIVFAPFPQVVQGMLGALGFTITAAFIAGIYGQFGPRLILNVSGGFTLLEAFALVYENKIKARTISPSRADGRRPNTRTQS